MEHTNKNIRVLGYYSYYLTHEEKNMSIFFKELEAVRKGLIHFRPIIGDKKVTLYTDQKAIIFLPKLKISNSKLCRIIEEITTYDLDIKYIPGKSNSLADDLSRMGYSEFIKNIEPTPEFWLPQGYTVALTVGGGENVLLALKFGEQILQNDHDLDADYINCTELRNTMITEKSTEL